MFSLTSSTSYFGVKPTIYFRDFFGLNCSTYLPSWFCLLRYWSTVTPRRRETFLFVYLIYPVREDRVSVTSHSVPPGHASLPPPRFSFPPASCFSLLFFPSLSGVRYPETHTECSRFSPHWPRGRSNGALSVILGGIGVRGGFLCGRSHMRAPPWSKQRISKQLWV